MTTGSRHFVLSGYSRRACMYAYVYICMCIHVYVCVFFLTYICSELFGLFIAESWLKFARLKPRIFIKKKILLT